MSDEEWDTWNRPFLVYLPNDGTRRDDRPTVRYEGGVEGYRVMRPPRGRPCKDCPASFAAAQRAIGACDGEPGVQPRTRPAGMAYPEWRRLQWREYQRRKRQRVALA
jgi:hypothetical protein